MLLVVLSQFSSLFSSVCVITVSKYCIYRCWVGENKNNPVLRLVFSYIAGHSGEVHLLEHLLKWVFKGVPCDGL